MKGLRSTDGVRKNVLMAHIVQTCILGQGRGVGVGGGGGRGGGGGGGGGGGSMQC